jgi:5-methylcytosine-specific restriction protein A
MPNAPEMHRSSKRKPKQRTGWSKLSRHARGYGNDWYKLRARVMERDKWLCQSCLEKGYVTPAKQVDHIIPKSEGGQSTEQNCRALCHKCHVLKTASESHRARKKS